MDSSDYLGDGKYDDAAIKIHFQNMISYSQNCIDLSVYVIQPYSLDSFAHFWCEE